MRKGILRFEGQWGDGLIEEIEKGFRITYARPNTHFNELDRGKSYLEPVEDYFFVKYERISDHYLVYQRNGRFKKTLKS